MGTMAIATRIEAIATRIEAIATRIEAMAIRIEAIAWEWIKVNVGIYQVCTNPTNKTKDVTKKEK